MISPLLVRLYRPTTVNVAKVLITPQVVQLEYFGPIVLKPTLVLHTLYGMIMYDQFILGFVKDFLPGNMWSMILEQPLSFSPTLYSEMIYSILVDQYFLTSFFDVIFEGMT